MYKYVLKLIKFTKKKMTQFQKKKKSLASLWYKSPDVRMHMSIGYLEPLVQHCLGEDGGGQ